MKEKTKRILVVVVEWRHRANGPLNPRFQSEAKSKIFLARKKNIKKKHHIKDLALRLVLEGVRADLETTLPWANIVTSLFDIFQPPTHGVAVK